MKKIKISSFLMLLCLQVIPAGWMQAQSITPGGANSGALTYLVWLRPDSYNGSVWANKITGSTIGDFAQTSTWTTKTPPGTDVGENYHTAVRFHPASLSSNPVSTAPNRLQSSGPMNIGAGDAITFIIVHKLRTPTSDSQGASLIAWNDAQSSGWRNILKYGDNNASLGLGWASGNSSTQRGSVNVPVGRTSLVSVDINNSNATTSNEKVRYCIDGTKYPVGNFGNINNSFNNPVMIGSNRYDITGSGRNAFMGDIQEVIILKRDRNTYPFMMDVNSAIDLQKINSYLAIKYGITLPLTNGGAIGDRYVNSANQTVWSYDAAFNQKIFGIGYDEASSLDQRQAKSIDGSSFTAFVGESVAKYNDNNDGSLENMQYIMFGGATSPGPVVGYGVTQPNGEILYPKDTPFANDVLKSAKGLNFRFNNVYKALATRSGIPGAATVKLQTLATTQYVLVSKTLNFEPANTRIYEVKNNMVTIAIDEEYRYIDYGGYRATINAGPAGVKHDIRLWLRADQLTTLSLVNQSNGGLSTGQPDIVQYEKDGLLREFSVDSWTSIVPGAAGSYLPKYEYINQNYSNRPGWNSFVPTMNYHPGITFHRRTENISSNNAAAEYLVKNSSTDSEKIFSKKVPDKLTMFVALIPEIDMYDDATYILGFGRSNTPGYDSQTLMNPLFGVNAQPANSVNRGARSFRYAEYGMAHNSQAPATDGVVGIENMFNPGSSMIMSYYMRYNYDANNNDTLRFGVNGKYELSHAGRHNGRAGEDNYNPDRGGSYAYFNQYASIGAAAYRGRALKGNIGEIIFFENDLSTSEHNRIHSYLALKYGITLRMLEYGNKFDYNLSDDQTFVWKGNTGTVEPNFHNNVAAIVRDDVSDFYNRQSHSTEINSILHVGLAGQNLSKDGKSNLGDFDKNLESVSWGNNGLSGDANSAVACTNFNKIFKRRWVIKKNTGDSSVKLLIAAQNNKSKTIPSASDDYYNILKERGKEIYMIVADDPEKLNPDNNTQYGDFLAIIPMTWFGNEYQCAYTFDMPYTYITFGYLDAGANCTTQNEFEDQKTFTWDQWTPRINHQLGNNAQGTRNGAKTVPATPFEQSMGDNITVKTSVTYDQGVYTYTNYPHVSTATHPTQGFEINRRGSNQNGKAVTVKIEFSDAMIPYFAISGIDSRGSDSSLTYDQVEVYGLCDPASTDKIFPTLSKASSSPNTYIRIAGNTATATAQGSGRNKSSSNRNAADDLGKVNVVFSSAIKYLYVVYTITGRETASSNNNTIWITPVNFKSGLPDPPLVNEDGIAFTKEAMESHIDACNDIYYAFEIRNVNMQGKYVKFTDVLTADYLTWKKNSLGLDEVNSDNNSAIKINNYDGRQTLEIDSLFIPCSSIIRFTAIAQINDLLHANAANGASTTYANQASIQYEHIVNRYLNPTVKDTTAYSVDLYTHNDSTLVYIKPSMRYQPVSVVTVAKPIEYVANNETEIEMRLNNPNSETLYNLYANFSWNEGFTLVPNSFTFDIGAKGTDWDEIDLQLQPGDEEPRFSLGKNTAGTAGFDLPSNTSIIRFKLKAPQLVDLESAFDANGQATDSILPLQVNFDFYTDLDNTCILYALDSLSGTFAIAHATLRIDSIEPNIGPTTGGTYIGNSTSGNPYGIDLNGRITVHGHGFAGRQSDLKAFLGGVQCKDLQVIDNQTLTCIPERSYPGSDAADILSDTNYREGVVNAKLLFNNTLLNESDSLVNAYTYRSPLSIEKLTPNNGATHGNQQIEIVGHNFLPPSIFNVPQSFPGFQVLFASVNDNAPAIANIVKVTNDTVYVTTQSHLANHVNVMVDNTTEKYSTSNLPFTYYPTVYVENGLWSEFKKWEDHSDEDIVPYDRSKHNMAGVIHIKANMVQDIDVDLDSITVYPNQTYTVDSGKKVKTKVFTMKDNASFLNHGVDAITEARAQHTLTKGRNWYVSSPVQGDATHFPTVAPALSKDTIGNDLTQEWRVEWYDETTHAWQSTTDNYQFVTGKGYTAYSEKADIAANFSGRFTDSNQSIWLTRQADAHSKRGFNLVGNPFPSYWRWTGTAAQAADTYSSIWYRTNPTNTYEGYTFWTYNASGNVAAAPGWEDEAHTESYSLAYIPPMQAFWVRLKDGKTNGTLTFANDLRSHANHRKNILKSTAKTEAIRPLLRLSVSDGNQIDETVIYVDPEAQNNFDNYDSDKMFAGRGVDVFTVTGTECRQLAINGLQKITTGMEIPLGFQASESGTFSFSAKEILNFDTLDVILRDKWRKVEFDLRSGGEYNFTSNSTSGAERFSIIFRRSGQLGIDPESKNHLLAYSNTTGQIVVELYDRSLQNNSVDVSVFDVTGRKLTTQPIAANQCTTLDGTFPKGIYIISAGKIAVIKVMVK